MSKMVPHKMYKFRTLYKLLEPEEGDPPSGIQWYCETCIPLINQLIKDHKDKATKETQTVNKSTQSDHLKIPICEDYRHGICLHGMSGKKVVKGESCSFRHPKKCTRYCQFGHDSQFGCNDPECRLLHPILCRYSVRNRFCDNDKCSYVHLKGTIRMKSYPSVFPRHERTSRVQRSDAVHGSRLQRRRPRKGYAYTPFDPNQLGFNSSGKNQGNQDWQARNQFQVDSHGINNLDFQYRDNDFPQFNAKNNCNMLAMIAWYQTQDQMNMVLIQLLIPLNLLYQVSIF